MNVDTPQLLFHSAGVNLAHVTSTVTFPQLSDPKLPSSKVVVSDTNAGVVGHHAIMKGQNSLIFRFQPSDLKQASKKCMFKTFIQFRQCSATDTIDL